MKFRKPFDRCLPCADGGHREKPFGPIAVVLLVVVMTVTLFGCNSGGGARLSDREVALRGLSAQQLAVRDSVLRGLESYYTVDRDTFRPGALLTVVPRNRPPRGGKHIWAYFLLDDSIARGFQVVFQVPETETIPSPTLLEFKVGPRVSNIILQEYMIHGVQHFYAVPSAYAVSFLDSLSESEVAMRVTNLEKTSIVHYPADEAASVMRVWRDYRALGGKLESPDTAQ